MPEDIQPAAAPVAPDAASIIPPTRPRRLVSLNHMDLVRAALIVIFALLALQLLWAARFLALTGFIGILFGLGASPSVDALERRGLRRGFGAPIVVFGALALVLALCAWSAPTLVDQSRELRTRFPDAVEKAELWLAEHQPRLLDLLTGEAAAPAVAAPAVAAPAVAAPAVAAPPSGALPSAQPSPQPSAQPATNGHRGRIVAELYDQAPKLKTFALGILTSALAAVGGFVLVLFLAVYIAAEPDLYKRGLLLLFTPRTRRRLSPVLTAMSVKLRRWLATQALAMLVIGAVTTTVLSIIGVRAAVPLGIIAGILEFIPNIGPTLSAIPAIAMAFVDSPQKTLAVIIAYWGIQFLENNLLIPYLMKEHLDLPPALTLMVQVVMAYVFGILGLFAATPLLAAIFVTVQMLHVVNETGTESPAATNGATTTGGGG
jgi:predicted PurR-regulated permease PerM